MTEKRLTGRVERAAIRRLDLPALDPAVLEAYRALGPDLASLISDVLDEMGLVSTIPGSVLRPMTCPVCMVGQALTLRNVLQQAAPYKGALERVSRLGEIEAHNLAAPGNVLVIQGADGISSMGGTSARLGLRQGEVGAIIDGSMRDVAECRGLGYPVWARSASPLTGKWRLRTVEINGPVTIAGVQVEAGDIAIADETGVCFVPLQHAAAVLERAQEIDASEKERFVDIDAGVPVPELAVRTRAFKMPEQA